MSYPTIQRVATYLLSKAPMSNFKLNQLCFYADSWNFVLNRKHFIDSNFQAWIHGAIDPKLQKQYENYLSYQYNLQDPAQLIPQNFDNISMLPPEEAEICDEVYEEYGTFSDQALETQIHQSDPWKNTRHGLKPLDRCNKTFSDHDLVNWFVTPK